jgi:methylenetetrahydrofolate reductase (NADPH)
MKISQILPVRRPFFSFEFFPPQTDEAVEALLETVKRLRILNPAFVSVTYGAGGATRTRTLAVAQRIKSELGIEVLAHLTCVGATQAEIHDVLRRLADAGIENIMALRGDPPKGQTDFLPTPGGFRYAAELIGMISREFDFDVGAAAYPEKHPEAADLATDVAHLAAKVRAGATFLVTQLFFDNEAYFSFVERARAAGIGVPIVPGIMPITNYEQIARMTKMCGATIPQRLLAELEARADEPQAITDLGVAFTTLQCADLLARGAPGIHFYTLNRSPATRAVVSALIAARSFRELAPT